MSFSLRQPQDFTILLLFFIGYCAQPLLLDVVKYNGGAHSSTYLVLIPHYYSMMLAGFLPKKEKLSECDWKKGMISSGLDFVNQLLKKAGLIYAGSAVYTVVDSSTIIWTALWSMLILKKPISVMQWVAILVIAFGLSLKGVQLNISFNDEEFIGAFLILIASVIMGLTYVLNESFMRTVEGPNLVCMMGIYSSAMLTAWTVGWTIPNFDDLVIQQIRMKNGSYAVVIACFVFLLLSGCFHSMTYWYIQKELGTVSSGTFKGLKVAVILILSHYFFCDYDSKQCLTAWTLASTIICVFGVFLYTAIPKPKKAQGNKALTHKENIGKPLSIKNTQLPSSQSYDTMKVDGSVAFMRRANVSEVSTEGSLV